jgi:2-C-methyl-D-erythritol 4-phosphate cytidylyltransferase
MRAIGPDNCHSMGSTIAVVLCAGAGTRAEHAVNKVYLEIRGVSMAVRAGRPFHDHPSIDEVIVVAAAEELPVCRDTFSRAVIPVSEVIPGGPTRHASESAAVDHLAGRIAAGDVDIVVVHDGARPLFDGSDLDELLTKARATGGAMYGIPLEEDLLVMKDGRVEGHRRASGLWRALTPQAFKADLLLEAFRSAARDGYEGTDTASTFERAGGHVEMIRGSSRNLKLTYPEDFAIAESLVEAGERT